MADLTQEDFARLITLYIPESVSALAFSPDGSLLAVAAADKVHIYRVPPQAKERAASGEGT
ncbi:MAG TPA: WD40 repeat domain-containing protein [Chthonomonadaceae bacterium]|nr:WD40 repeat domain-containing protein [Chthonomonadaceae bacterium]